MDERNSIVNELKEYFTYSKESFDGFGLKVNADIYSNENNIREKVSKLINKIKNDKFIIIFTYKDHPLENDFVHVVTHGNGWCFFYSLGSLNHKGFKNYLLKRFKQNLNLIFNNDQIKINQNEINDFLTTIENEKLNNQLKIYIDTFEFTKNIINNNINKDADYLNKIVSNFFIKLNDLNCNINNIFNNYLNYYNSMNKEKMKNIYDDILSLLKNCKDFIPLSKMNGDELGLEIEEDVIPAYKEFSIDKGSVALYIREIDVFNEKVVNVSYWLLFTDGDVKYINEIPISKYYVSFDNVHASKLLRINYNDFCLKDIINELNKEKITVFYGKNDTIEIYE